MILNSTLRRWGYRYFLSLCKAKVKYTFSLHCEDALPPIYRFTWGKVALGQNPPVYIKKSLRFAGEKRDGQRKNRLKYSNIDKLVRKRSLCAALSCRYERGPRVKLHYNAERIFMYTPTTTIVPGRQTSARESSRWATLKIGRYIFSTFFLELKKNSLRNDSTLQALLHSTNSEFLSFK